MFSTRLQWVQRALTLIQDERASFGLGEQVVTDEADSVVAFLARYSPRLVYSYLTGTGSLQRFPISGLSVVVPAASWIPGLSYVELVEYPLSETDPAYLQSEEWRYWPSLKSATHLNLLSTTPASASNNVGVLWATKHTISDTESSVQDFEEPAYEYTLAAFALRIYAAKQQKSTRSGVDGDQFNAGDLDTKALSLADKYLATAGKILGVDLSAPPPVSSGGASGAAAGGWVDLDVKASGMQPIFRSRLHR